jgi:O-antigen ligase
MLLMASLPFDRFYSHLILISLTIHTLIHLKKGATKPVFKWRTLTLQSVFFITILSTIYSINKPEGFTEWGKQVTILLIPLVFCFNPLDLKKYGPKLLLSFALVCTLTTLYLYADALRTIRHYHLAYSSLFSSTFTNHNFSQPIDMHATFFSMQVALSLVYLLVVMVRSQYHYKRLYLACSVVLIAGLIQLSSKSVFIALIIIINVALPWFLLKNAARWRFASIAAVFTLLIVVAIFKSGALKARFVNELKSDVALNHTGTTFDSRFERWKVAADLIGKRPLVGYGAGSEIQLLQDGFFKNKLYNSYLNRLNTHSQYLSFLIKSGSVGLMLYLATLAFGFRAAFRQKDILFFAFLMLIATVSLSENLLDVDKGIFFYALFFSFFMFWNEKTESNAPPVQQEPSIIDKEVGVLC